MSAADELLASFASLTSSASKDEPAEIAIEHAVTAPGLVDQDDPDSPVKKKKRRKKKTRMVLDLGAANPNDAAARKAEMIAKAKRKAAKQARARRRKAMLREEEERQRKKEQEELELELETKALDISEDEDGHRDGVTEAPMQEEEVTEEPIEEEEVTEEPIEEEEVTEEMMEEEEVTEEMMEEEEVTEEPIEEEEVTEEPIEEEEVTEEPIEEEEVTEEPIEEEEVTEEPIEEEEVTEEPIEEEEVTEEPMEEEVPGTTVPQVGTMFAQEQLILEKLMQAETFANERSMSSSFGIALTDTSMNAILDQGNAIPDPIEQEAATQMEIETVNCDQESTTAASNTTETTLYASTQTQPPKEPNVMSDLKEATAPAASVASVAPTTSTSTSTSTKFSPLPKHNSPVISLLSDMSDFEAVTTHMSNSENKAAMHPDINLEFQMSDELAAALGSSLSSDEDFAAMPPSPVAFSPDSHMHHGSESDVLSASQQRHDSFDSFVLVNDTSEKSEQFERTTQSTFDAMTKEVRESQDDRQRSQTESKQPTEPPGDRQRSQTDCKQPPHPEPGARSGLHIRMVVDCPHPHKPNFKKVLAKQKNCCFTCGLAIKLSRVPGRGARYCYYTDALHCTTCHVKDKRAIPALMLWRKDASLKSVCRVVSQYLDSMGEQPILSIATINRNLYLISTRVQHMRLLRQQLERMRRFINDCRHRDKLQSYVRTRPYFLIANEQQGTDLYSIKDLEAILAGNLIQRTSYVVEQIASHITDGKCAKCYSKGKQCALCHEGAALFSFDLANVVQCSVCRSLFHKQCHATSPNCCVCRQSAQT
jgi:Rubicon Homology Domain